MPNRPGVYATGEDRGVRPYGRPLSPGDFYNPASGSYDARPEWLGPAARPQVTPEIGQRTAELIESGDVLSTRSPVLPGGQPFTGPRSRYDELLGGSRQAYTMGIDRAIEDSPYEAAQRQRTASEGAALIDMANEERQQQAAMEAEAVRSQGVMEGINQVLESPIGKLIQSQLANQQMPMSANSPFALPQRKAGTEDIRSKVGLKGSYTQNAPTYTAPKSGGDIGTIDLRADAPKPTAIDPRNYFEQVSLARAAVGDIDGADKMGRLSLAYTNADKVLAETDKTKIDSMKSAAEYEKLVKELESDGTKGIDPERLAIAGNQAKERRGSFVDQYVEYQSKLPKNVNISPDELPGKIMEWRAEGDEMFQALPANQSDIKIMDALEQMFSKDSATSKADQKITKSKPPPDRLTKRAE